ncbi:MAG TPA: YdcF family protein [Anaerolineae bacterium]|jgi:uncharacterized SAM-binding protein YcdF (DUF218 family)
MPDLIIVLGHFDDTVHLTSTGRERLDLGIALLQAWPGALLTVTGCAVNLPRTAEVLEYLRAHGIAASLLAPLIDSHNTAEDAFLTEPLVQLYGIERLLLVTSDYHLQRARYIYERVFPALQIEPYGAQHRAAEQELHTLRQHEAEALQALQRTGLYRPAK